MKNDNKNAKKVYVNTKKHSLLWTHPTKPWCNMLQAIKIRRKLGDNTLSVEHTPVIGKLQNSLKIYYCTKNEVFH